MAKINNIDFTTLKNWLDNDEAVLIDVREAVEYKVCSIPNSRHLPLSQVCLQEIDLADCQGKKLVFHCKSGKRANIACQKLISEGIDLDIFNLEGGIDAWNANNLSTNSQKDILPLDRQVQIAVSLMILSGLILNYFLQNPIYLLLPLMVGLGLLNAGISGWCGLAKLIAKMPWNR